MHKIIVYGSLAYDRILFYPGRFRDAILPDKLHSINVSFAVPQISENFGGTAANIAYNLSLLELPVEIRSSVGDDFEPYKKWLLSHKVGLTVNRVSGFKTASAYIMTDAEDNQITAFYSGALSSTMPHQYYSVAGKPLIVVAPGNVKDMLGFVKISKKNKLAYIFDPGQQVPAFSAKQLQSSISQCVALIGNDYEINLVAHKIGVSERTLQTMVPILIKTLGPKGSELWQNGKRIRIPAAKVKQVIDPTGAGDTYRAGLIYGMMNNQPLEKCARIASVVAAYTVELHGTQTHNFTLKSLAQRYQRSFGESMLK